MIVGHGIFGGYLPLIENLCTYNRVVYHEAKHETDETDETAECTKIKLSTATLHTCRYVVSTAQDKLNQTLKHGGQRQSDQVRRLELPARV